MSGSEGSTTARALLPLAPSGSTAGPDSSRQGSSESRRLGVALLRCVLSAGDCHRARPGRYRTVPGLEPRALGDRPGVVRWQLANAGHPIRWGQQRDLVLPRVHCRFAFQHRVGAAVVLPCRLGPDRRRVHPQRPPSLRDRRFSAQGSDERLAWLIVIATIPVGLTGLLLEHTFRTIFAKPLAASVFLVINGLILLAGDRARRRAEAAATAPGLAPRARMPIAGASPELDAQAAVLTPSLRGPRSAEDLAEAYASIRASPDCRIATVCLSACCRCSRCSPGSPGRA